MSSFYGQFGKRTLDLVIAVAAMLAISPLLLALACLVRLFHGSPVLFRQHRAGRGGRAFVLYKLRTMTSSCDEFGQLLPDEQRLTRFGQFLRSSSLDELPELWNVMRGDMSLVGPRPLLLRYLARYTSHQARRHEVRPGLTGWAQVNGRNSLSWEERFELDVAYVERCSLWFDLRILVRTVLVVLQRQGITAADHATAPEFPGSAAGSRVRSDAA